MRKTSHFKRPLLIMLAVVILFSAGMWAYAKYIYNETVKGTLTLTANLGNIEVKEHKAERKADGSYSLSMSTEVDFNTYKLIPGLDVPKDPFVRITNKSTIPVYIFIKVDTNIPADSGVNYQLADHWQLVAGTADIYVYSDPNGPIAVTDQTANINSIAILKTMDDEQSHIEVSQKLNLTTGVVYLNFYAAMIQTAAGMDISTVEALFSNQ